MATSKKFDVSERVDAARSSSRKLRNSQQLEEFKKGQIALWDQDDKRGIPNAFARAPIFNVTGRGKRREVYTASNKLIFKLPGQGEIRFNGEALNKFDELVWFQLVWISKMNHNNSFSIRPAGFLKSLHHSAGGKDYKKLTDSLARLAGTNIEVHDGKTGVTRNTRLLALYSFSDGNINKDAQITLFTAEDDLLSFYADQLFTLIDFETCIELGSTIASSLYVFYSSHREPYPMSFETLAGVVGLAYGVAPEEVKGKTDDQLRQLRNKRAFNAKQAIVEGLETLMAKGILTFTVKENLVSVKRIAAPGRIGLH